MLSRLSSSLSAISRTAYGNLPSSHVKNRNCVNVKFDICFYLNYLTVLPHATLPSQPLIISRFDRKWLGDNISSCLCAK